MPPQTELLSLVLTLQPAAPWPADRPLPGWWGRAAQALFLHLVAAVDPDLAARLHDDTGDAVRPYTASTLMGRTPDRSLDPAGHYLLRFTCLTPDLTAVLLQAAQPGGRLAPGAAVELEYHPFTILEVASEPQSQPWAAQASYAGISAPRLIGEAPPRQIGLQFTSPVTFHSAGVNFPFPRPDLVFGSLLERWNAFSPLAFPPEARRYAAECLAINKYDLQTRPVPFKNGALRIGAVGRIAYTAVNYDRYWLGILHTLAAFAPFSGVGQGSAVGMGQCRPD